MLKVQHNDSNLMYLEVRPVFFPRTEDIKYYYYAEYIVSQDGGHIVLTKQYFVYSTFELDVSPLPPEMKISQGQTRLQIWVRWFTPLQKW